jgi:hypothetical protein
MFKRTVILIAILSCALANPARAQLTNLFPIVPATKLESFETNLSVVILKATSDLGSISGNSGVVWVRCREMTDMSTGRKEEGIAITIMQRNDLRDTMLIDYDEIASLLSTLNYLSKLDVEVTPLTTFDAAYTTKGGFRVAALGSRVTGGVQFAVRDARTDLAPVIFSRDEISRFSRLIEQAKGKLDALRGP